MSDWTKDFKWTEEEAIAATMAIYESPAWNVSIIPECDDFPAPERIEPPLTLELHRAGSMFSYEETGKKEPVAMLRRGAHLVAFFTVAQLEHAINILKESA